MRQLKVHGRYFLLLLRKHPLYVCLYIFFELYNAAYLSFKNVYLYPILLGMIADGRPFSQIGAFLLAAFLIVAGMLFASSAYHEKLEPRIREQLTADLDIGIMDRLAELDVQFYDSEKFHDEYVLSTAGVSSKVFQNFTLLVRLAKNLFGILTVTPLLLSIGSLWVCGVVIAVTLISYKVNQKMEEIRYQKTADATPLARKADYINSLFRKREYAKEMRLNRPEDFLFRQYEGIRARKIEIAKKYGRKQALLAIVDAVFLQTAVFDLCYSAYLVFRVFQNSMTIGDFVGARNTIQIIRDGVMGLISGVAQLKTVSLYLDKFDRFSAMKNTLRQGSEPMPPFQQLDLADVCFSYGDSHRALQNVNLTLHAGEKIVVVGTNGAGKTTLVKLLMHLYDVSAGAVRWNGTDIREFSLKEYYGQFGAAFQDCGIYPVSINQNVSASREYREEQVRCSLEQVGLSYLERLPKGLNAVLSKELYEDGVDLSGGERQKIAIARGIYQNRPILILDEPSSALDSISEYELNQLIDRLAGSHTVIVISHRLSAAKTADRIVVLKDGAIAETGSHDQLIAKNGEYARLYSAQAGQFAGDSN